MQGVSYISEKSSCYEKGFDLEHRFGSLNYRSEVNAYKILYGRDITPKLIDIGRDSIQIEKFGFPLYACINDGNRLELALKVYEKILMMNSFGVQHRDLHQENILVDEFGEVRFIDFELSISGYFHDTHSYDMEGPCDYLGLPHPHKAYRLPGVFWDSKCEVVKSLSKTFCISGYQIENYFISKSMSKTTH